MIVLTRLNDAQFAINPDLIERVHANPDTTLVMVDGAKYIVTESIDEVIALIAQFRARVISMARDLPQVPLRPGTGLGLVPDAGAGGTAASNESSTNTVPLRPRNK
ncbi:flagellar FlbD family protein [Arthrobacter sp.]|uniref:flagellar FlbD family protein n=1 Tax=Arthrobacter sp. TaxID=1667 RepID=UPI002899FC1F|nr:flagellar FlbD family protein [Arthrobacter sp.]